MRARGGSVLLTLLALSVPAVASPPAVDIGDRGRVDRRMYACQTKVNMNRLWKLAREQDAEAMNSLLVSVAPDCVMVQPDTIGVVDEAEYPDLSCLRPRGQAFCRWMPSRFIVKP